VDEPAPDPTLERVIARHAAAPHGSAAGWRVVRDRLQRLLSATSRGHEPEEAVDELLAMLSLIGVGDDVRPEATRNVEYAREHGIELRDLLPIIQAYARGITRIVDAEESLIRTLLRDRPEPERVAYLDRLLGGMLPMAERGFELLHVTLLGAALRNELTPDLLQAPAPAELCVALIDLCGSTAYLAQASDDEAERLVDALFEAGQACALARNVRVVKYVGDGIFLVGRDVAEVAAASFAALEQIEATLPLPARAGIASGPLVRRSGDYFGLSVNLAQLLTKAASAGEVLATAEAAEALPAELRGTVRRTAIRGREEPLAAVPVRRPRVEAGAQSPA
jgi:adenylate cyclase